MATGTPTNSFAAERAALALQARRHVVVEFALRTFGGSALTSQLGVPKGLSVGAIAQSSIRSK